MTRKPDWDEEFDLVIVGSGGGGLCAALAAGAAGKSVVILEKQGLLGGSTAMSGGVVWVPNNRLMKAAGAEDSIESALRYMREISHYEGPATERARQESFVRGGVEMVDFLLAQDLDLEYVDGWADYYPSGSERGRLIAPRVTDTKPLGAWRSKLQTSMFSLPVSSPEGTVLPLAKRTLTGFFTALRMLFRLKVDRIRGAPRYGLGTGLVAQLLRAVLRQNVPLRLETAAIDLIEEDGRVAGVVARHGESRSRICARHGVLIASGGFARDPELRERYLPKPTSADWTIANAGDTGDLFGPALRFGAETELLDAAVWAPATIPPGGDPVFVNGNVNKPGSMLVAQDGQRFCSEANSYHNIVIQMYRKNEAVAAVPCWIVMDSRHLERYPFGARPPGKVPEEWLANGYFVTGETIAELAAKTGIDPEGLGETVARMNQFARTGRDLDFGRGDHPYDRYNGDPTVKPNPSLAPIDKAPFYAVKVYPSDGGVMGGLSTDADARVVRRDGSVIEGLYACGTAAASVFGRGYPCSGGALAVSLTWGYIAGAHVARLSASSPVQEDHSTTRQSALEK